MNEHKKHGLFLIAMVSIIAMATFVIAYNAYCLYQEAQWREGPSITIVTSKYFIGDLEVSERVFDHYHYTGKIYSWLPQHHHEHNGHFSHIRHTRDSVRSHFDRTRTAPDIIFFYNATWFSYAADGDMFALGSDRCGFTDNATWLSNEVEWLHHRWTRGGHR